MTKKSMGQFMAALRKANGMTQQEVADRLNVSNKAVSRWEREECAPDLSLIPAIAEMYGVTCDELLKGERIMEASKIENSEVKADKKVDRQLKALVNRSLSSFKTLIWISLALSLVGLICMFGISYGFYRPVIGFAVMLLFEVVAFMLAAIAVNKLKEKKTDNELFENAEETLVKKFNDTLGKFSFIAFFAVFAVVLISLPLICFTSSYVQSVLAIGSYFMYFSVVIALVLVLVFAKVKEPYIAWITEQSYREMMAYNGSGVEENRKEQEYDGEQKFAKNKLVRRMNMLQLGFVVLASILFIVAPYGETSSPYDTAPVYLGLNIAGLVILLANIICFIIFLIKCRDCRSNLILPGIRNILMISCSLMISNYHSVGWIHKGDWNEAGVGSADFSAYERYDVWYDEYLFMALGLAVLIAVVFALIEIIMRKRKGRG